MANKLSDLKNLSLKKLSYSFAIAVLLVVLCWFGFRKPKKPATTEETTSKQLLTRQTPSKRRSPRDSPSRGGSPKASSQKNSSVKSQMAAPTMDLPPVMKPEFSKRWSGFLRSSGQASMEEDLKTVHQEYKEAFQVFGETYKACETRRPNPRWVSRAKDYFVEDDDYRYGPALKKGLILWSSNLAKDCRAPTKQQVLAKEDQLIALMRTSYQISKKFSQTLSGYEKKRFQDYLNFVKRAAESKKGPLKKFLALVNENNDEAQIEPIILEYLENDPEFKEPFSYTDALDQWNNSQ